MKITFSFAFLFLISLSLLAPSRLAAQPAGGAVSGRVTDSANRLPLGGVRVSVEGTELETFSTSSGFYLINNVPAGTRTVILGYVGYPEARTTAEVTAGRTTTADYVFASEVVALEKFVIEGSVIGTARAINQQRAANSYTNIVAADEIGRFPDQNAAEALSRLPGVSVYRDQGEGRFVNVRGINYTLGNVTLDGSGLASPESGQRAIALDVVPSDSLGALEVSKVPTPDMTAEGLGGSVNLRSKSPFDGERLSAKLTAQGIYTRLTGETDYKVGGEASGISEDGRFGLLVGFSQQVRNFGSHNVETDRWTNFDPPNLVAATSPLFSPVELQFRDYRVERERTGVHAMVELRPTTTARYWLRGTYNDFRDTEDRQTFFTPVSDDNVNAAVAKTDNTTGVVSQARRFSRRARDREKLQDLLAFTAGGEVQLGRLTLDAQAAYSRGEEDKAETQVRFRRSTRDTSFRYTIDGYDVRITQLNTPATGAFESPAAYNQFQRFDVESDYGRETERNLAVNARFDLASERPAYVKFGGALRNKEKQRDENIYEFGDNASGLAFTNYTGGFSDYPYGPRVPTIQTAAAVGFFESNPGRFTRSFADERGNDYVVDEDVVALYGMTGITFGRVHLLGGVRMERTELSTTGNVQDADLALIGTETAGSSYTDILPGLHFRYDLTKELVGRASWSHSIVRPAFSEVSFGRTIDTENLEITERNPGLEALRSTNFDLSVERYLPSLGLFSVAGFYKDISDFTFLTAAGTRAIGANTYDVFSYENGNDGHIYGVELAYQQQLRFLPAPFNGLGFQSNLTLSRSEADYGAAGKFDFVGQSELLGNVALTYENRRFHARVAASFRSERLREDEDISFDNSLIYIDDSVQLDLTLAYKMSRNFEAFAEIVNVTNEPFRVYSAGGPRNQPKLFQQIEVYDYSVYFGVRWKL